MGSSSGDSRASPSAVAAEGFHELLVPGLVRIVWGFVLFGVLGHDQRGPEVSVAAPGALDHRSPSLGEQIGRRALVLDGDGALAVGEDEVELDGLRIPLERAR